jgi:multiple sugar transport system permease protein
MNTQASAVADGYAETPSISRWERLKNSSDWQGLWFMLPATAILVLFLAYPLLKGVWISMTDASIGNAGAFVGLEIYRWLWDDGVFWLAVVNTIGYTIIASLLKFVVGLYLALLMNKHLPFKSFIRAVILIPFVVPTVLSAMAFWWIFDSQFSIISWVLRDWGWIDKNIDFLGDPNIARASVIFANVWRGIPFVAITLLAGLQTLSPSLYEAAAIDGATPWQQFRRITLPMLMPIISVVMTFTVLFTFSDFQLIWSMTRGGPVNSTQLMATLSYQRGILGGNLGEGAAIATAMAPFLIAAIAFSWFGLNRRKWQ